MRIILLIFIVLLSFNCASTVDDEWYIERISHWQIKEQACQRNPTYYNNPSFIIDQNELNRLFYKAKNEVEVVPDPVVEWRSSCEIAQDLKENQIISGDCDTAAIWFWRKLRDKGWPDDINGMMIVYFPRIDENHLINAIRHKEDEFVIFDITGSFYEESATLVIWFNLFHYLPL